MMAASLALSNSGSSTTPKVISNGIISLQVTYHFFSTLFITLFFNFPSILYTNRFALSKTLTMIRMPLEECGN